jgi:hypothetical protein
VSAALLTVSLVSPHCLPAVSSLSPWCLLTVSLVSAALLTVSLCLCSDVLKELDEAYERYRREADPLQRRRLQLAIQKVLIRSQELGDEKIQIAAQMVCNDPPPPPVGPLRSPVSL